MKSICVLVFIFIIPPQLNGQLYTTRNNYTGNWEDPDTWDNTWNDPSDSVNGISLYINGFVSIRGSLTLTGTSSTLTVHDTLVIYGDLNLVNNINLIVHGNGIIIIRGNLTIVNNTDIFTNGYVIVTGDFLNESNIYDGSFWTTGNPSHVFIAGSVPEVNDTWYPVLDCDNPILDPFANSGCAYGNETDLMNDPIYGFYTTTCGISVSTGSNSPICTGQILELTASGGAGYLWSGPASFSSSISNPKFEKATKEQEGNYVVHILISGCTIVDTVHVVIHDNPEVIASVNNPACEGDILRFSASGANEYRWSGPASFSSDLSEPVINSADSSRSGLYVVRGTSDGCSDTDSLVLIVHPVPVIEAELNSPVCEGSTVYFMAAGATMYDWTGPQNFSSNNANPVIRDIDISSSGRYVLHGNSSGCTSTDTVFLTVNPLPQISVSSNSPLCEGDDIMLAGYGGYAYFWQGPAGFISTVQNPVIANALVSNDGEYTLLVLTPEGCRDSTSFLLEVNAYPVADAGDDQVLENSYRTNMRAVLSGGESGTWLLMEGSGTFTDQGSPDATVAGLSDGENIFRWTVMNGTCQASDEVAIRVIPLFIPNVITPNSDGKNDFLVISSVGEGTELIIFNRWGITEYLSHDYNNSWDGVNSNGEILPDDTYFYVLKLRNGTVRKGSVLIKRK